MQFEEICREHYAGIYNYILAKTGKKEAAEDITQNVFLTALLKGDAFLHHEKPAAFLYTTARNLVLEYYRQNRKALAQTTLLDESAASVQDPYEELLRQKSACINEKIYQKQVLQKLKPRERDLYRKYYIDKKPMQAIAEELHMSGPAVRMKYMRIRRKVQKIITDLALDDF